MSQHSPKSFQNCITEQLYDWLQSDCQRIQGIVLIGMSERSTGERLFTIVALYNSVWMKITILRSYFWSQYMSNSALSFLIQVILSYLSACIQCLLYSIIIIILKVSSSITILTPEISLGAISVYDSFVIAIPIFITRLGSVLDFYTVIAKGFIIQLKG